MAQYSSEILDLFGSPELSDLTLCGAKELPEPMDYLSAAIWNHIVGTRTRCTSVRHLELVMLKRTDAACDEYSAARRDLLRYVEGFRGRNHRLRAYLSALRHFEQCLSAIYQAAILFNKIEQQLLNVTVKGITLFNKGERSDLERISNLYNLIRHFSAEKAKHTSAPIWITNSGLKSVDDFLHFEELYSNITALLEVAQQTFIEIPKEARARKQLQRSS
jgi:hypothetical protein